MFKGIITSNVTGFNINIHVATTQIKLSPEILYHLIFQSHIHIIIFDITFISKKESEFLLEKNYNKKKKDNCEDINN